MALEDLNPAVRVEEILDGADIEPATRLEYFMKKAANEVPKPAGSSDAGKVVTVNEEGDGFELGELPSGLPEYTSADKGKVLTIVEDNTTIEPKWENVGGYVAPTSSETVINTIQSLVSDIMTSIITGNKTNIVCKRAILTHTDLASDTAILREAAEKYCSGVHTLFPLAADTYSTVVNGYYESSGTGANLQVVVPNYVIQITGVGNKVVFLVISIASLGNTYQIEVSAQIKENIT